MEPKPATIKAMNEVLGPIISITLVLMSVFLPSAFLGGITGQLYQQFALTIAATAGISAINAVTLKPAQCAMWLRAPKEHKNLFTRAFNRVYGWFEHLYFRIVRFFVRIVPLMMLLFIALIAFTIWWYQKLPTGFLPTEDQGYILISVQLPDAASQARTRAVMEKMDAILKETPGIEDWFEIGGLSILDRSSAPNMGTVFVTFKPWDERLDQGQTLDALLGQLRAKFGAIQEAIIFPFAPPAIRGLGVRGGFEMVVQDRGDLGRVTLFQVVTDIIEAARSQSRLAALNTTFRPGVPQVFVDIDRAKVKLMEVPLGAVFDTMQANLGSAYVNDFNRFGRVYQVRVQAQPDYRAEVEDIRKLEVRNRAGKMVPLGTLATVRKTFGPQIINRYNMYPSASISGEPAPGFSTGEALNLMEQIAADVMPPQIGYEWTGMAYQEKRVGGEAYLVFAMAVILVYLVLAAQYESWFTPLAVILVVPAGLLGAVAAVAARGMDNNVYTQIGIVLIIALASKNAILIVEFARDLREQRQEHPRRRCRGRPDAVPADPDDVVRVHPRRGAAGDRHRRRCRRPAGTGHGRVRRHDRLDISGDLLRARVLRRVPDAGRMVERRARTSPVRRRRPTLAASCGRNKTVLSETNKTGDAREPAATRHGTFTVSRPLRVTSAFISPGSISTLMNWMCPSQNAALEPPGRSLPKPACGFLASNLMSSGLVHSTARSASASTSTIVLAVPSLILAKLIPAAVPSMTHSDPTKAR